MNLFREPLAVWLEEVNPHLYHVHRRLFNTLKPLTSKQPKQAVGEFLQGAHEQPPTLVRHGCFQTSQKQGHQQACVQGILSIPTGAKWIWPTGIALLSNSVLLAAKWVVQIGDPMVAFSFGFLFCQEKGSLKKLIPSCLAMQAVSFPCLVPELRSPEACGIAPLDPWIWADFELVSGVRKALFSGGQPKHHSV